jgi:hypothetical protein
MFELSSYELKRGFNHPKLLPKLNFKGSHKSVHGIPAVALISRPGDFRRKLEEEPRPIKIPSIK